MPKFPSIPRLSIVIPYAGDAALESSLVSVLENRPNGCEILVTHDGSYLDPFDLSDEVCFVACETSCVLSQIHEAAEVARGHFIHVLMDGNQATEGWTLPALEQFECHDAGLVAPAVTDRVGIQHVGWKNSTSWACQPMPAGGTKDGRVDHRSVKAIDGCFLAASFWRRDVLRGLRGTYRGECPLEASLVYGLVAKNSALACRAATASRVVAGRDEDGYAVDVSDSIIAKHGQLQAIVERFQPVGLTRRLVQCASTMLATGIGSAIRRASAPLSRAEINGSIDLDASPVRDEETGCVVPYSRTVARRAAA